MRKSYSKLMALGLAAALTAVGIAGCGSNAGDATDAPPSTPDSSVPSSTAPSSESPDAQQEAASVTYPLATEEKLTFGMTAAAEWNDRFDAWTDLPIGKVIQEETGVELEMVHVANNDAMKLMLSDPELPDIILFNFGSNYTGGEIKAIEDGIIFPMDAEFLQQNAPDYWEVLNSDEDYWKGSTNQQNQVFGFTFIMGDDRLKTGWGMTVRDDWCEQLGLDAAEIDTAEEFHDMLRRFKDELNVEIPFTLESKTLQNLLDYGTITSAFDLVTRDAYHIDGKVHLGYMEPEYKDVLAYLNQLYEEELLDLNFNSNDSKMVTANILSGKSGVSCGALGGGIGTWLQTNKEQVDAGTYSLAGLHNLVKNDGDKSMYGFYKTDVIGKTAVITNSCKNKELAAQFLNYGYTDAGHMTYVFGIEGESYEMVDGEPVYTDYIMSNPNGLTVKKAMSEYTLSWDNGPFVQDLRQKLQTGTSFPEQEAAWAIWEDTMVNDYFLPKFAIAEADLAEYSRLKNDLTTYVNEQTDAFVRGKRSLDEFDDYLAELKSMGVDRLIEIMQAAVDEYNAR